MNELLLRLSDNDYRRLKWISDKLGLSVSDCLRALIPQIQPPRAKVVKERDVAKAEFDDLVPIKKLTQENKEELRGYALTSII